MTGNISKGEKLEPLLLISRTVTSTEFQENLLVHLLQKQSPAQTKRLTRPTNQQHRPTTIPCTDLRL